MLGVVVAVLVLSTFHLLIGFISLCIGIAASIQADVWLAHSVSPIWSGAFVSINALRKACEGFSCFKLLQQHSLNNFPSHVSLRQHNFHHVCIVLYNYPS